MRKKNTNITEEHQEIFTALRKPEFTNFALFSCFVNGKPTSAIVAVNKEGEEFNITPLFVAVTPEMILTDHEGKEGIN
jgi:hypothetical protein